VLDRSGLGRLLEQMEADGLVERTNPPQDRRAVLIRLTSVGRNRFVAALPLVEAHYRRLLRGVMSQDFKTLIRLLRRIKANALMMADASDLEPE
jgi:DNA-binding MarR family transcriptional regulator